MNHEVTADFPTLLDQAEGTAGQFLRGAACQIDMAFGDGYAKKNPNLVAAFLRASSDDFNTAMRKIAAQEIRDSLDGLAYAIAHHSAPPAGGYICCQYCQSKSL